MSSDIGDDIQEWWEDYEEKLPDTCPNCSETYDEIDREYQICSKCGYKNYEYKKEY